MRKTCLCKKASREDPSQQRRPTAAADCVPSFRTTRQPRSRTDSKADDQGDKRRKVQTEPETFRAPYRLACPLHRLHGTYMWL